MIKFPRFWLSALLAGLALALPLQTHAHGEDKPGPNGGMIRMPGPFHTELVKEKNGHYRVYLLDMDFKNPTTQKSSVSAQVSEKGKFRPLNCTAEKDSFLCKDSAKASTGELLIKATRNEVVGNEAKYPLSHH